MLKKIRRMMALLLCALMVFGCGSAVFAESAPKSEAEQFEQLLDASQGRYDIKEVLPCLLVERLNDPNKGLSSYLEETGWRMAVLYRDGEPKRLTMFYRSQEGACLMGESYALTDGFRQLLGQYGERLICIRGNGSFCAADPDAGTVYRVSGSQPEKAMSFAEYLSCAAYENALAQDQVKTYWSQEQSSGLAMYNEAYRQEAAAYWASWNGEYAGAESDSRTASEAVLEAMQKKQDIDIADFAIVEVANLYTGNDLSLLGARLSEIKKNDARPNAPNLSLACIPNEGKYVEARGNNIIYCYYMQRNNAGEWTVLESHVSEDGMKKDLSRYTFRTDVEQPAIYMSGIDGEVFVFDDTAESCLVLNLKNDRFYRSEDMIHNWYSYWMEHIDRQPYAYTYAASGKMDNFGVYTLEAVQPKLWVDVLIWGGIIGGILLLIGLVVCLLRRSREGSVSWIQRIPMSWRMLTGASRIYWK